MLILPPEVQRKRHHEAREGLTKHFNEQMEIILNEHKNVEVYWILGKVKMLMEGALSIARPFLQACLEKPPLVKESFVYEVDNKNGKKTLLWVMHPDETLVFPTLGKKISVANSKGA